MSLHCEREQELLDALASGRWPRRADPQLRDHAAACEACADVALIAAAFFEDRDAALAEAVVPPASAVWWRSQMRAREEAARLASRPIVVAQVAATACVFVVSAVFAPAGAAWIRDGVAALGASEWWALPPDVSLSWILGAAAYTTVPLLAVGLWLVLAPVVVYLALDE